jgi:hypothetical protein
MKVEKTSGDAPRVSEKRPAPKKSEDAGEATRVSVSSEAKAKTAKFDPDAKSKK